MPQIEVPDAPAFGSVDAAPRAAVLEYAGRARFVGDQLLTDEQGLLAPEVRGPTVRLQAVEHAHLLTQERLVRGALIARLVSAGDYAPLGLRRGVHYVFVDSAAGWRSIIVPTNNAQPVRVMQMAVFEIPHLFHVPVARFFEVGVSSYSWIRCGKKCCIPCDPPSYSCPTSPFAPLDSLMPLENTLR